jgi:iron-sulfur cluster assembly protein
VDGFHIRVSVKGGGCSGLTYVCEAEEFGEKTENDITIPYDGFDVLIDKKSMIYLKGMELDYDGGLGGTGFKFTNPLASSTCGCGESFSV